MRPRPHGRHRHGPLRRTLTAARRPAVAATLALTALAASAAGWSATGASLDGGLISASDTTDAQQVTNGRALDTFAGTPVDIERQRSARRAAYRDGVEKEAARIRQQEARKAAREQARQEKARREAKERAEARKRAQERAEAKERAAAAREAQEEQASRSEQRSAPAPTGDPRSIAQSMLASFGWDASQFGCLNALWNKESGWDVGATNPSSGAYGIPQALPGSKMATAGGDWQTNPATQIRWGLGYIQASYGSPCGAWGHSQATGWY
ncbi:MAG TPA: hypothetical protein VFJ12_01525 [Segeticoccus sp.]|jgi:hypothetical protein|nr:hypothetical protein [Segeticoccus sp.]